MLLLVVAKGRYEVAAIAQSNPGVGEMDPDAQAECADALNFLVNIETKFESSASGMLVLFDKYAEGGRGALTGALFHEADRKEGIWEFIKGRLRIYCFKDDDGLVLLSHGIIKKAQNTAKSDVKAAVRQRKLYEEAKARKAVRREVWNRDDQE